MADYVVQADLLLRKSGKKWKNVLKTLKKCTYKIT